MIKFERNLIVYFYIYFAINLCYIYINIYLPIYLFTILNVDRTKLAFIQILAYSALFTRPILAIFFDFKGRKEKLIIIVSSFGFVVSFIFFIFTLNYLILFGVFLFINFATGSVMYVAINKIIVESSLDEKTKDKNAIITHVGSISGAILPNIFIFLIFTDLYSLSSWHLFFVLGIFSLIPLIFLPLFVKNTKVQTLNRSTESNKDRNNSKIQYVPIVLVSMIIFLSYAEKIYEYPMEPWLLAKFGEDKFMIIVIAFLTLVILNALGIFLAGMVSKKFDRIKLLTICSFGYGILTIIAPFTNILVFFVLFGIMQILSGFISVNIFFFLVEYSKKKVVMFQTMSVFYVVAIVIFVPLGTYLSTNTPVEFIIVMAGIAKLFCVIPILFLKKYYSKSNLI